MTPDRERTWSSGAGTAELPRTAPPSSGTGVPAGSFRGSGSGQRFGETERTDAWWLQPLIQAVGLTLLGLYATWAAFQGRFYEYKNYLSPFYSPLFTPSWWPFSPAFLILGIPLGFRATCYYYRKAYYRAFFGDPAACAVGELKSHGYCGEAKFPFILQNVHRYFLYLSIVVLAVLWIDVVRAFSFAGRFGIGGGSVALLACTGLLTLYTLSCHSLRHLIGGKLDCFSCVAGGGPRRKMWSVVSVLNEHHMGWAWWSLFAVCFADFYVRLCALGMIEDPVFYPFSMFDVSTKPFG